MRKLQAVPDRKLKSCCACTKLLLKFLSDRATARQSKKARAFLDLHGETSGKSTKGEVQSTSPAKTNHKQAKESDVRSTSPAKTNHKQAKESEVPKHEPKVKAIRGST